MFREMRRKKQLLSAAEAVAVLTKATNGVLACQGDQGYPYAVPLSFVWHDGKIYFHSAKSGHKIDAIMKDSRVSFAVIDEDRIISAEYTSYFRSVIAFGSARVLADGEERLMGLTALTEKYSGDQPAEAKMKEVADCTKSLVIAIDIDHLTGKEAIEFVRSKQK